MTNLINDPDGHKRLTGLLQAGLPVCIAYVDHLERYRFINSTYEEWFGVKADQILGAKLSDVIGTQAYNVVKDYVERALKGEAVSYEARVPYKGGATRHIQADLAPDVDPDGSIRGYYALIKDISDKKNIELELLKLKDTLEEKVAKRTAELKTKNLALEEEISRRNRTEIRLLESEKLLRTVLETMNEGVVVFDTRGLITYANEHYAHELGVTPDDLVGKSPFDFIPENKPLFEKQYQRRKQGQRNVYRLSVYIKDNKMKPVVVSSSPILDDNGVFQGSVTVFTDMTEIQRAEEIIRRAEAKYRMIVELASEGIGSLDREGNIEYVNDQMAKMFGYAPDEMIGTHYTGHMDESMIPEAMTRWQAASRMDSEKFDFRFRRKDGSPLWALVSGAPLYDDSGEFMGAFGMVSDITQRKEAEDELKKAKTLLQNVIEHMPVAVFLKDANDFKFKMLNRAAAGLAGLKAPEAALGKTDFDLSTKEQAEYFRKVDLETIEKGSLLEIPEEVFTDPAGKKTFLRSKKLPLYNELGLAEHILVISEDITREKQAREVIETALAEKEILLREVHHRVKNNLAIISSLLNLQSQHASDKPLAKVFEEIQLRIRSMASAHELLYGSPYLERIDAREYIHQLLDHISISQSRIGVRIEIVREIEETSFGLDTAIPLGLLLTELVSNCLEHAFDHGQSGVALISLKRIDHERFELMVKDDGKGFPSDVEINNPRSMGLDLVNAFAEMLKGEIITDLTHGSEIRVLFKQAKKKN